MTIREQINTLLNLAKAPDIPPGAKEDAIAQARSLCREHKIGMGSFEWPDEAAGNDLSKPPDVGDPVVEISVDSSIGQMVERLLLNPALNFVEIASRDIEFLGLVQILYLDQCAAVPMLHKAPQQAPKIMSGPPV